jgi:hypothetical protein
VARVGWGYLVPNAWMDVDTGWRRWREHWVPAAAGPRRWFLRHLLAPHGSRERLLARSAERLPAGAGAHLLLRPASDGARQLEADLGAALAPLLGAPVAAGLPRASWIVTRVAADGAPRPRLVAFGFPRGAAAPAWVLKAGAADDGDGEGVVLESLQRRLCETLRAGVPRVVAVGVAGWRSLLLTALPGRAADVDLRRGSGTLAIAARHFTAAAQWLRALHADTGNGEAWLTPSWDDAAPAALRDRPEPAWLAAARHSLHSRPLPRVARHGDFRPRNLLLGDGGRRVTGVVEWRAASDGSPLADAVHFAFAQVQLVGQRERLDPLAAFRTGFVATTPLSSLVSGFLRAVVGFRVAPEVLAAAVRIHLLAGANGRLPRAEGLGETFWLQCYRTVEEAPDVARASA